MIPNLKIANLSILSNAQIIIHWDEKDPYRRDIFQDIMKEIVNRYKEIRINKAKMKKEKEESEKRMKAEEKPIEIKKPNIPIINNKPKPITVEKVIAKPITISKTKCEPITIIKPKETPKCEEKPIPEPIIIQKEKVTLIVVKIEKEAEFVQNEEIPIIIKPKEIPKLEVPKQNQLLFRKKFLQPL
jgi:hypothetical protein